MRQIGSGLLSVLVLFYLSGCSSVRVSQDFDESVDFSSYRTFDWAEAQQPLTGIVQLDNQLLDRRIRSAVEQNLVLKGFIRETSKKPDLLVVYRLSLKTRIESDTVRTGVGYGGYYGWGGFGFETRIREYEEGTLVIDIGESKENKLIWRGTGSRRVTRESGPEESTRIVNQTVAEILKQFPPQKK